MTDRIQAALDVLDKATLGPWEVVVGDSVAVYFSRGRAVVYTPAGEAIYTATLIAAAPDLAAEVIRLRKWQSEAKVVLEDVFRNADPTSYANRLITEAEGE